jgi:hypothetical protein|tara:strand:+ start:8136 stop:8303 length:168 start_codon:yes stop_codon:yes gene_type:complete
MSLEKPLPTDVLKNTNPKPLLLEKNADRMISIITFQKLETIPWWALVFGSNSWKD